MTRVGLRICPDATPSLRIVRVHDLSVPGNLSRVSWKLSRTVLRGGTNSNVGPLLDMRTGKTKQPYCFVSVRPTHLFAESWTRIMNQLQAVALNEGLRRSARFNALGHMESAQRCGRFGLASHLLRQVRSPSGSRMCVASH